MDYRTARKIADSAVSDTTSPIHAAIGGTASDLAAAEQSIRAGIRSVRSTLDGVERKLDAHPDGDARLNDLGELQHHGPALDVAVVRYMGVRRQLDTLLRLAADL